MMKKSGRSVLVLALFFATLGFAADEGKIAVASEEQTASADVGALAARSNYFLIFDEGGKFLEALGNPYQSLRRRAGVMLVTFLDRKGVTCVVSGAFGAKMIQAMELQEIKYFEFQGSVEEAVKKVIKEREN